MARKLMPQADSAYSTPGGTSPMFPAPIKALRSPLTSDIGYNVGQMWVNTSSNQCWIMTSANAGSAVWALSSPGASDVDTINSLSPVAGDILIDGGTNITDINAGHTVTLNLNPAITLATSVTSPLYTSGAGVDTALSAPAGQDIILTMGDAAGANKVSFVDSTAAEVFAIDSNGGIGALAGLTVTGALTQTAGIVNIGADAAANAVNIATGAAAKVLIIGSTNTTAATTVQSGTGDLKLTSTDEITLDSAGVLELNSSAGVIGIGNDAVAQAINVGTGAAQRTITIGNVSGTSAVNINTGTNGSAITTTNGTFAVATGTGAINLGIDAVAHTVTIGNVIGATAVNLNAGTGGTAITTTNSTLALASGTGAINVGVDAVAHTVTIGNAIGATSVVVNGGTGAMDFGANGIAHATTIGSTVGAASTTLQSGTGDLILTSTDAITADCAGVLELNSTGAAIGIGTDANNFSINVGTSGVRTVTVGNGSGASSTIVNSGTGAASFASNATDHTTTIGSVTGVSATTIQGGTGGITFVGDITQLNSDFITRTGDDITFQASPIMQSSLNTGVAPTGSDGDVNLMMLQEGIIMEQFIIETATVIAPRFTANGLLVSLDNTIGEGAEYNFGAALSNSRHAFTIGTSPAFFFEVKLRIADMDGAAPYVIGFRKVAANNKVMADYTDYASIGMISGSSTTKVVTATELNAGGQTVTDTTDLWGGDGTTNLLRVSVDSTGNVSYLLNGVAPTVVAAFQFDNADVVAPYVHVVQSATPGAVHITRMKVGFQP